MKRIALILLVLTAFLWVSCDKYDSWTTSPNAKLEFSVDTVNFDTIISTHSSTTKTLQVWNRGREGIRINRVALQSGSASHFRVNVDGQFLQGGSGEEFEVRGEDSLFVRVEVKLPEGGVDDVVHYEDDLLFTLESGVQQRVKLIADGQDVFTLKGEVFLSDTTLKAGRPYLIYDSLVVPKDVTLTLEPGVCLMFHDSTSLHVRGRLMAEGTLEKPIIFRGDRLDRLFDDLPYDNTPNRWGGIHFYGESYDNVMTQCDVHSGQYGVRLDSLYGEADGEMALVLTNSVIHNVDGRAFDAKDSHARVVGTQISNSLGHTVCLLGGSYFFVHCTIAQYYYFSYDCGDALHIANTDNDFEEGEESGAEANHPFEQVHFLNCVIMGRAEDVVMGKIVEYQDLVCNYLFQNCYLRTVESEDESRFVKVTYDKDTLDIEGYKQGDAVRYGSANFAVIGKNYLFDYTPDSLSGIRGMADILIMKRYSCTFDRKGKNRMADGAPDAGAYEF